MKHPVYGSYEPATANPLSSDGFHNLYVALGLQMHEVGYPIVARATDSLGTRKVLTSSLWQLATESSIDHVFKELNESMLDRRIDSYSSLLIMDPVSGSAKWHLRQPLSDLLAAHWAYQNNIFISFSLQSSSQNQKQFIHCLTQFGIWAPLSKTTWYLSTTSSSKHVFQSLLNLLDIGDQLCVFDSNGQIATWHNGVRDSSVTPVS